MNTALLPVVDLLDGTRLTDVQVELQQVVRLGCGCQRWEGVRPDGSPLHLLVGEHCFAIAGPDAAVTTPPTTSP